MAVSYEQARAACVAHYAKRVMDAEYRTRILPTDPAEVFRIYGEIQKEIEDSKSTKFFSSTTAKKQR